MESKKNIVLHTAAEDDDCIILEGNPFAVTLINNNLNEAGTDDLIVLHETGEVACRDYPHPRHLCATLPFASTSHFEHCRQCHCYVCDSLAPCASWGTGTSATDHCHATDTNETWKIKRNCHRLCGGTNAPAPAPIPQSPKIPRSVRLSIGAQYPKPPCSLPYQSYQYPDYTNPSYSYPSQYYTNPQSSKAHNGNGSQGCTNPPYSLAYQNNGFQGENNLPYNSRNNGSYYGSVDYSNHPCNLLNGSQGYATLRPPDYIYGSQGYANPTCGLPNYSYGSQNYTNYPC